ncbi:MAG: lysylphosphatidylglycerol synthase transmembrane domain-containing protein [Thermoanaerobaculia bacterium]
MKRILQIVLVIALTVFFLGIFLWKSNLHDVWALMKAADPLWLIAGLLINFSTLIFRSQRWRILIGGPDMPGFYPTFFANCTGYMLSTVLPIRAGDVARPALLARRSKVRFVDALGTVLSERVLDLISILALFVYFCIVHWNDFPGRQGVIHVGGAVCGGVLATLILFMILLGISSTAVRRLHERLGRLLPKRFRDPWMRFFDAFVRTLDIVHRPAALATVLACTAAIWLCLTAQFWAVMKAVNHVLPFDSTYFLSAVTTVGIAIPTPGGVGGFHKISQWLLTTYYGFDIDPSVAITLLFHLVGTLPVVIAGVALLLREGLRFRDLTAAGKEVADPPPAA